MTASDHVFQMQCLDWLLGSLQIHAGEVLEYYKQHVMGNTHQNSEAWNADRNANRGSKAPEVSVENKDSGK